MREVNALLDVREIMYYGRCYNFGCQPAPYWWLCRIDERVVSLDELCSAYGFHSVEEIEASGAYIPLFQTDIVALEREFLAEMGYDDKSIRTIMAQRNVSYDVAFNIFVETPETRFSRWNAFEREKLMADAIAWCKTYGINYMCK